MGGDFSASHEFSNLFNFTSLQESEMVRETSQWEREEMEKVVSAVWGGLGVQ